jgi:predicted metal-dependent HD superfamily phosphohydrolase
MIMDKTSGEKKDSLAERARRSAKNPEQTEEEYARHAYSKIRRDAQYGVKKERFGRTVAAAFELLEKKLPDGLFYHNVSHTKAVYFAAEALARAEKLSEYNTEMLLIAAAFHDTGYVEQYSSNEPIGAKIAREAMLKESYAEDDINMVENLIIRGTSVTFDTTLGIIRQHPITRLERVMSDADLSSLGGTYEEYSKTAGALRKEQEARGTHVTDTRWEMSQVRLLSMHMFMSEGARELKLQRGQMANLEKEKYYLMQLTD